MTGARIEVTGVEPALEELGGIAGRLDDPTPLWDAIGASLAVSTQMRFERGEGPDGSPWPPSIRALATGGKTLIDSARLVQSITHNAFASGVEVGTNMLYAAVHQFGAVIRPVVAAALRFKVGKQWVTKQEVRIPARPYLGLDDDDQVEILAIARDWIVDGQAAGVTP
jgi:phage virion morphogenesis protein